MSNRPRRRRVVTPAHIFPTRTPRSIYEELSNALEERVRRDPHRCELIEHLANTWEVTCSCGFVAPAPFGLHQAERIRESHWSRFRVIPDTMGAKYAH